MLFLRTYFWVSLVLLKITSFSERKVLLYCITSWIVYPFGNFQVFSIWKTVRPKQSHCYTFTITTILSKTLWPSSALFKTRIFKCHTMRWIYQLYTDGKITLSRQIARAMFYCPLVSHVFCESLFKRTHCIHCVRRRSSGLSKKLCFVCLYCTRSSS